MPLQDKSRAKEFADAARERNAVVIDPANRNRAIITIGPDAWPLPVPLVRKGGRWSFDAMPATRRF